MNFSNTALERLKKYGSLKDGGISIRNLAEAYLDERARKDQRLFELAGENKRITQQLEDALKDRSRYKELLFVQMYTPPMAKVAQFIGGSESMMMARADVAVTIMIASPHDKSKYKFWVDVIKNRFGPNSRHAFDTLLNATEFVRRTWGPK